MCLHFLLVKLLNFVNVSNKHVLNVHSVPILCKPACMNAGTVCLYIRYLSQVTYVFPQTRRVSNPQIPVQQSADSCARIRTYSEEQQGSADILRTTAEVMQSCDHNVIVNVGGVKNG